MNKNAFVILLLALCIVLPSRSQYVIQVPYVFVDLYSGYPSVGQTYFSVPRPDETYNSVRIRSLGAGLSGLTGDDYSDHFRNPAYHVSEITQLYGDLGSVNDNGKFLLGGVFVKETKSFTGFLKLEQLMKRRSSYDRTSAEPYSSLSSSSTVVENSPKNIGGRAAYTTDASDNFTIGLSYEFSLPTLDERDEIVNTYQSIPLTTTRYLRDNSRDGKIHRISAGTMSRLENATLEFVAVALFTNHSLQEFREDNYVYSYSSRSKFSYPTEINTKGFLFEAVYGIVVDEMLSNRFLAHVAYTKYDASGTSFYEHRSWPYGSYNTQNGARSASGTIIDLKGGAGLDLKISEEFSGYGGLSVNYVRNRSTGSEKGTVRDSTYGRDTTSAFSNSLSDTKKGFDIRLPLAVEYFISEYATLRGGLEPRYSSGETYTEATGIYPYFYGTYGSTTTKTRVEASGLSLSTNIGVSLHHGDYGQIELLFGSVLTETKFWSVAIRYFL